MIKIYNFEEEKAKIQLIKKLSLKDFKNLIKMFPNSSYSDILSIIETYEYIINNEEEENKAKARIISIISKEEYYDIIGNKLCKDNDIADKIIDWIIEKKINNEELKFKEYLLTNM
mgnify:FL=1